MKAKSKRQALVRYEDRSKSVKFYNAETQSVLTSRNFHFLEPSEPSQTIPEQILITPDNVVCEGESMDDAWNVDAEPGPSSPQK